jgi:ATP-dependent Clp protease, protease subunit
VIPTERIDDSRSPERRLFEQRVLMLGSEIDGETGTALISRLLVLEHDDAGAPITLYVNSPGGEVSTMMAIYDTMQHIRPPVHTRCVGVAASAAALILAGGEPGHRQILPRARVLIHQPHLSEGMRGQASDIAIQAAEIARIKDEMIRLLASHTGRDAESIRSDTERDRWLSATEALEYGIVDEVV